MTTRRLSWEVNAVSSQLLDQRSSSSTRVTQPSPIPSLGTVGKESACQCRRARDAVSIPGSGRFPGLGNVNPLQYSGLDSMDRGAWQATVHGVPESRARLSTHVHAHAFTVIHSGAWGGGGQGEGLEDPRCLPGGQKHQSQDPGGIWGERWRFGFPPSSPPHPRTPLQLWPDSQLAPHHLLLTAACALWSPGHCSGLGLVLVISSSPAGGSSPPFPRQRNELIISHPAGGLDYDGGCRDGSQFACLGTPGDSQTRHLPPLNVLPLDHRMPQLHTGLQRAAGTPQLALPHGQALYPTNCSRFLRAACREAELRFSGSAQAWGAAVGL